MSIGTNLKQSIDSDSNTFNLKQPTCEDLKKNKPEYMNVFGHSEDYL